MQVKTVILLFIRSMDRDGRVGWSNETFFFFSLFAYIWLKIGVLLETGMEQTGPLETHTECVTIVITSLLSGILSLI